MALGVPGGAHAGKEVGQHGRGALGQGVPIRRAGREADPQVATEHPLEWPLISSRQKSVLLGGLGALQSGGLYSTRSC